MPIAIEDLNEIADYIAKQSPKYADLVVDRIFDRTEILVEFPLSGRMVPELEIENVRELIEGNYRIIYEVKSASRIEILSVLHGARNFRG